MWQLDYKESWVPKNWCFELTPWKRPWCWVRLRVGEGDGIGWDGWMALPTQCTWIWVSYGSWWWTGKPAQSRTWLKRLSSSRANELNWLVRVTLKIGFSILPSHFMLSCVTQATIPHISSHKMVAVPAAIASEFQVSEQNNAKYEG